MSGRVSSANHPREGVLVEIGEGLEGASRGTTRGFIPYSLMGTDDRQRRACHKALTTAPGSSLILVVREVGIHTPKAKEGQQAPPPRQRIILQLQAHHILECKQAKLQERVSELASALEAGMTEPVQAVVTAPAVKNGRQYGVWVDLQLPDAALPALLHCSQMLEDRVPGDEIMVCVTTASMEGSRARVGVSELFKRTEHKPAASLLTPGFRTTGTNIRTDAVVSDEGGRIEGFKMEIKGVTVFLPLEEAGANPTALLQGHRNAKVWVTADFVGEYPLVTRKGQPALCESIAQDTAGESTQAEENQGLSA